MSVALAAPHAEAVAAGERAVAAGGNAMDAALAAAAMLAVVYPHQCAIGGDLIAVVRRPDGTMTAVTAAGHAPREIHRVAHGWRDVPRAGAHAVTVPGMLAGWRSLHAQGAALPFAAPLAGAAEVADDGTAVSAGLERAITARAAAIFADAGMREVFAPGGRPLAEGELLRQPALAATLRRLADDPDDFYRGHTASALVRALRGGSGVHVEEDFADYAPEVQAAASVAIGGALWSVAPPPSVGAILLGVIAVAMEDGRVNPRRLLEASIRGVHTRAARLADPRTADVDLEAILALDAPTMPASREPRPQGDTAAVVASDDTGFAVTIVQSVYQTFGSGLLDAETGILLHNRGSAFAADPDHPAMIRPGARPPHTLTPAIVETDDVTVVAGCQGGRAQPWILAQLLPDALNAGVSLPELLARPRWVVGDRDLGHAELTFVAEPGVPDFLRETAGHAGLRTAEFPPLADEAGHVQFVRHRRTAGVLEAASDPRADGVGVVIR